MANLFMLKAIEQAKKPMKWMRYLLEQLLHMKENNSRAIIYAKRLTRPAMQRFLLLKKHVMF